MINKSRWNGILILFCASPQVATYRKERGRIAANILYRYENGELTNEPLWVPKTGEFPHGAIVPGVNDIPGKSAFDVHRRLNVNCNNCPFPAGYPTTNSATSPQANSVATLNQGFLSITLHGAGSSITINTDAAHPARIEIFNLQGKKIQTFANVSGNSVQWQRGSQPAGVYFVKASSGGIAAAAKMFCGC